MSAVDCCTALIDRVRRPGRFGFGLLLVLLVVAIWVGSSVLIQVLLSLAPRACVVVTTSALTSRTRHQVCIQRNRLPTAVLSHLLLDVALHDLPRRLCHPSVALERLAPRRTRRQAPRHSYTVDDQRWPQ